MKTYIISFLLLLSVGAIAQPTSTQYLGAPKTLVYSRGYLQSDSGFRVPVRDTTGTAWVVGDQRYRTADSAIYVCISTNGPKKWQKLGAGGSTYTAGYGISIASNTISADTGQMATKAYVNALAFSAGAYTDEQAQDAVGTILSSEFTYNDATPGISISAILASKITQSSSYRFVTDTEKATWNGKADAAHSHIISNITGLQTALDGKLNISDTAAMLTNYRHWLAGYAPSSHSHTISNVTGLQSALDAKEAIANKATNFTTLNNTLYPTTQAVANYIGNGFVPYTGATGNVNLGGYDLSATNITISSSGLLQLGVTSGTPLVTGEGLMKFSTDQGGFIGYRDGEWKAFLMEGDVSGGGGGEANTASNLGGGLSNFDSKSGVDLRFNSFATADFNLSANVIAIDYTNGQAASTSTKGFLTSTDWNTFNGKQGALTLTTTGTSGAATLIGNTLNIPQYSGGGGGTPAGANTQIQFNSSGAFGASSNLTWDGSTMNVVGQIRGSTILMKGADASMLLWSTPEGGSGLSGMNAAADGWNAIYIQRSAQPTIIGGSSSNGMGVQMYGSVYGNSTFSLATTSTSKTFNLVGSADLQGAVYHKVYVHTDVEVAYTVSADDYYIELPDLAVGGSKVLTLPAASSHTGRVLIIHNKDATDSYNWSFSTAVYYPDGTETLIPVSKTTTLISNGTNWRVASSQ